ncbi:MAG: hypothetical protein AAF441_28385, partial [Pseudomonadota bacterium]
GPLKLRDSANKTDIHCILFTDMLLFTKPSKRDKLKIIKPPIRLDSVSIHEMKENSEFSWIMPIVTANANCNAHCLLLPLWVSLSSFRMIRYQ